MVERYLNFNPSPEGIIIDIRNNRGGSESKAAKVANIFTDEARTYRYTRIKDGCERNQLTDFFDLVLEPNENYYYDGPVVVLMNKQTFSAAEDFAMMMDVIPNAQIIGGKNLSGFATGPSSKELSNGWRYRISRKTNYDLSKNPIVGGLVPDEIIEITDDQINSEIDSILERAIEILM